MRRIILVAACASAAFGQAMIEHAAAAAGGTVGGVAGKKVSDGITKIFNKVDAQTKEAAKQGDKSKVQSLADRNTPLLQVGPGAPKKDESGVVPPPPARRASAKIEAPPPPPPPAPVVEPPPPPPPPKVVSVDELKSIAAGMKREDVLKIGPPSARITMFEDGHLLEIFRYMNGDSTLGVVRLADGSVQTTIIR